MTAFIKPTMALLDRIEPDAGDVLTPNKHRSRTEFWPDWDYIASTAPPPPRRWWPRCPCAPNGVPEHRWNKVIRVHCPQAHAALAPHGKTAFDIVTGRAPAALIEPAAQLINIELGGYEVLI